MDPGAIVVPTEKSADRAEGGRSEPPEAGVGSSSSSGGAAHELRMFGRSRVWPGAGRPYPGMWWPDPKGKRRTSGNGMKNAATSMLSTWVLLASCASVQWEDPVWVGVTLDPPRIEVDTGELASVRSVQVLLDREKQMELEEGLRDRIAARLEARTPIRVVPGPGDGGYGTGWASQDVAELSAILRESGAQAVLLVSTESSTEHYWIRMVLYDPLRKHELWRCISSTTILDLTAKGPIQSWPGSLNGPLCDRAVDALGGAVVEVDRDLVLATVRRSQTVPRDFPRNGWAFGISRELHDTDPDTVLLLWILSPIPLTALALDIVLLPITALHDLWT